MKLPDIVSEQDSKNRRRTWVDDGCHQDVLSQEELIIQSVSSVPVISPQVIIIRIRIIVKFPWFGLVHEERSADRFARACVLVHGIVDVLDQAIPQLDILAADGRHRFWIPVRFLIRLVVVVIVVAEPRQEGSHDGPTSEQL